MINDMIRTPRLDLVVLTRDVLEACVADDRIVAERLLGMTIPDDWYAERWLMELRLDHLKADPELETWLLRAVCLREQTTMIGYVGFHSAPAPAYLAPYAPAGVEFGYTIFEPYRRCGYAREACAGLMDWAQREHGVQQFVLSISPDNEPSLRLARSFGFHKVGSYIDDEDGQEDIFVRDVTRR